MIKGLEQRLATEQHPSIAEARKIHSLMEEIIHHTHNLAHHFSSLDVQGDNLSSVLKGLAENVKKMFAIPCAFNLKGAPPDLSQHTTVQLYKIAQEAVSNAIKHGKATQVAIGLVKQNNQLVMTIKNDGLPFSQPAGTKNRMGLRIMNYRANTIGATLEIKPLDKNGTLVTCLLPIKNSSKIIPGALPQPDKAGLESNASGLAPGTGLWETSRE
jgi:signal transduction histidine kinase